MGYEHRDFEDAVTLEETSLVVNVDGQEIELFSCQNFSWDQERDVEVMHGPGLNKKVTRKKRGVKRYSGSIQLEEPNYSILTNPEDFQSNQRELSGFAINGTVYTDLMDLPPMTIVNRYPTQDGTTIARRFKKVEFSKNSGSMAIGEAAGRTLDWVATEGENLF